MSKSLKGTKTEQNLLKAFAGESQARNRYTYFASAAKKEGYERIWPTQQKVRTLNGQHSMLTLEKRPLMRAFLKSLNHLGRLPRSSNFTRHGTES